MPTFKALPLSTGTAFVALIVLIFAQALNSLWQLHTLGAQIHTVVEHHNRKIDIITQTQVAAHIRTDSLFRMALANEAFERDAHFMAFNRAGFLVGSGRNALRQLGLTPAEQVAFDEQTRLVNTIQTTQEEIIDLLNAGLDAEARRHLAERAIPLQEAFNLQLAEMRDNYQAANLEAQRRARSTYRQTVLLTLGLGIGALVLALLIAWHTLRKARLRKALIQAQLVELEQSRAALREEATHDPLTGLANRRLFYDRLRQAIRHAHRYGGRLGILYIDLDRFKAINDRHGHHVGDAVLTEVARLLLACVRESDTVARLGGDEFVVLLEEVQGRQDCIAAALKIEQVLAENALFNDLRLDVEASVGQCLYPDDGEDEDTLVRAADAAMYRVKSGEVSQRQCALPF
ncbi:MAG: diguanylate cyclase [Thiobacillus sp.]|nr:diguanylate cyclase [Thiobacillus sp.]